MNLLLSFKFSCSETDIYNVYGEYEATKGVISALPDVETNLYVPCFSTLSITKVTDGAETNFISPNGKTNEEIVSHILLLMMLDSSFCEITFIENGLESIVRGFANTTVEVEGHKLPTAVFCKGRVCILGHYFYENGDFRICYSDGAVLVHIGLHSPEIIVIEDFLKTIGRLKVDSS